MIKPIKVDQIPNLGKPDWLLCKITPTSHDEENKYHYDLALRQNLDRPIQFSLNMHFSEINDEDNLTTKSGIESQERALKPFIIHRSGILRSDIHTKIYGDFYLSRDTILDVTNFKLEEMDGRQIGIVGPYCFIRPTCAIASAVYGSYDHPRVMPLREVLRDQILNNFKAGRTFIGWYYSHGRQLAKTVNKVPGFKIAAKTILTPCSIGLKTLQRLGFFKTSKQDHNLG